MVLRSDLRESGNEFLAKLKVPTKGGEPNIFHIRLILTGWVDYFVKTVLAAQTDAEVQIDFTLKKVKFFERFKGRLGQRQMKVVGRMLEEGPKGFQGV